MCELVKRKRSFQTLCVSLAAIRWVHLYRGLSSPCLGIRLARLVSGLKRKYNKDPITIEIAIEFYKKCLNELGLKFFAAFVLAFNAVLRKAGLLQLRRQDITTEKPDALKLQIENMMPRLRCAKIFRWG